MKGARVVVVGGGLAGLSAALTAADAGAQVTLLESRPRLGGATHSFSRAFEGGELTVDNGQHVFLRCCTAYQAFLDRLGVRDDAFLQPRLEVPIVDPQTGREAILRRDGLPPPAHLARTLLGYRVLTPAQRLRAIRGALALRHVHRDAASADARNFGDWLRAHGQTSQTIARLFDIFTVATLNARCDEASLRLGAMVFQDGLLRDRAACDIGYSQVPLGRLHGEAGRIALERAGAQVRMHTRVRDVRRSGGRWLVETRSNTLENTFEADAVVLATPHDVTAGLLAGAGAVDAGKRAANLGFSPILNVHVVYDRTVLTRPFVAAVDSPAQFVFDRTVPSGLRGGQYVAVSVSAAHDWIDEPVARLRDVFLPELAKILPASRDAAVRDFFVTRERTATFRPVPGSSRYRLSPHIGEKGLVVAGAWTDTGWPATMEGAVRSGVAAADALGMCSPALPLTRHDRAGRHDTRIDEDNGEGRVVDAGEEAFA
jgi:squalene-associated FAD-dependent desaturase